MSTPYTGGNNPQDNHPENFGQGSYGTPNAGEGNYYGYNGYGSEGGTYGGGFNAGYNPYDVNASAAGWGATRLHGTTIVDGTYGDGVQPHPVNDPQVNGWYHVKGTGKMSAIQAWGYGFKQTFANWKVWVPVGALLVLLPALLSLIPFVGNLVPLATLFFYPFIYSFALLQTLSRQWKFDGVKSPTYGQTLGMSVVVGLVNVAITLLVFVIAAMLFGGDFLEAMRSLDPVAIEDDPMALAPIIGSVLSMIGITMLVMFFITPLFVFQAWYAADNAGTFGSAFSEGFRANTRNYGQLLLYYLIYVLLTVVIVITLGLAAIVVVPAGILALAYAYRQVSGGPVPTEGPAETGAQF